MQCSLPEASLYQAGLALHASLGTQHPILLPPLLMPPPSDSCLVLSLCLHCAEAAAHPEPDSRQGRVRRPALPSAAPHQPFVGGVGAPPHLLQELPGPPPRGGTSGDDSEDESHQGDDDDDEEADEDEDGDEEASEGAEASEQEPAEQLHAGRHKLLCLGPDGDAAEVVTAWV